MKSFVPIQILYLFISNAHSLKIVWYISKLPVIFGQPTELICEISETQGCRGNTTRRIWSTGPKHSILTIDGKSSDESKYTTDEECNRFSLKIKNISTEDVNKEYSCLFGFQKYTSSLVMNGSFESLPSFQSIQQNSSLRNGELNLRVVLSEVHPVPNCFVWFKQRDLSSNLSTRVTKKELFYNTEFFLKYRIQHVKCGYLKVKCIVGMKEYLLIDEYIFDDKANSKENCTLTGRREKSHIVMLLLFGLFGVSFGIVVTIIIKRNSIQKYCSHSSSSTVLKRNDSSNRVDEIKEEFLLKEDKNLHLHANAKDLTFLV